MSRRALWAERGALAVIIAGFAYGAITHAADFVRFGFAPYEFGPPAFNLFWNSLVLLDAMVVALLLLGWRRGGLALGLAVMLVDVGVNSYAWQVLGIGDAFATAVAIQAAFLGFLLGATPFLWPAGPDFITQRGGHKAAP